MTDRIAGFIITLKNEIREDDAEATINAIRHIRGVISVHPVVADTTLHMARSQARYDLQAKIDKVFIDDRKAGGQ